MTRKKISSSKNKEDDFKEYMEIGGSPSTGVVLKQILETNAVPVNRIIWSPNNRYLALQSKETIHIWDIFDKECIKVIFKHHAMVRDIAWSPDGYKLASCDTEGSIYIWNSENWSVLKSLNINHGLIWSLAWSPNGKMIAVSTNYKTRHWCMKN